LASPVISRTRAVRYPYRAAKLSTWDERRSSMLTGYGAVLNILCAKRAFLHGDLPSQAYLPHTRSLPHVEAIEAYRRSAFPKARVAARSVAGCHRWLDLSRLRVGRRRRRRHPTLAGPDEVVGDLGEPDVGLLPPIPIVSRWNLCPGKPTCVERTGPPSRRTTAGNCGRSLSPS
jgi:hypothetical protein